MGPRGPLGLLRSHSEWNAISSGGLSRRGLKLRPGVKTGIKLEEKLDQFPEVAQNLGLFKGLIWSHLGLQGLIWNHLGLHGLIWSPSRA